MDGDGLADLLIGAPVASGIDNAESFSGSTYLIEADQLEVDDVRGEVVDGIIDLGLIQCFLSGTQIAIPCGAWPVEVLTPGDPILSADGRVLAVRFTFYPTIATRFVPAERLTLVRIRAGALGEGLPLRDLILTADHALVIDGILIDASALVNGTTIDWMPLAELGESVTVYYIETDAHEVILAESTPSEIYIDYAGRRAFTNYL